MPTPGRFGPAPRRCEMGGSRGLGGPIAWRREESSEAAARSLLLSREESAEGRAWSCTEGALRREDTSQLDIPLVARRAAEVVRRPVYRSRVLMNAEAALTFSHPFGHCRPVRRRGRIYRSGVGQKKLDGASDVG